MNFEFFVNILLKRQIFKFSILLMETTNRAQVGFVTVYVVIDEFAGEMVFDNIAV